MDKNISGVTTNTLKQFSGPIWENSCWVSACCSVIQVADYLDEEDIYKHIHNWSLKGRGEEVSVVWHHCWYLGMMKTVTSFVSTNLGAYAVGSSLVCVSSSLRLGCNNLLIRFREGADTAFRCWGKSVTRGGALLDFLCLSTSLMVLAEVAVAADTLCVQDAISVLALCSHLSSPFSMVAILAHAISIIRKRSMCTLWDSVANDIFLNAFVTIWNWTLSMEGSWHHIEGILSLVQLILLLS